MEPLQVLTAWSLKANGTKWRRNTEENTLKLKPKLPCLHTSQATAERASSDRLGRSGQICACLSVIPWHNSLTSIRDTFSKDTSDERNKMRKEHQCCQNVTVETASARKFLSVRHPLLFLVHIPCRPSEHVQRGNWGFADLVWSPVSPDIPDILLRME